MGKVEVGGGGQRSDRQSVCDRLLGMQIYKIFLADEWAEAKDAGRFEGSPIDRRDGFIHFSPRDQLAGTIDAHFQTPRDQLVIAEVDAAGFGSSLRWETSRDGVKFPHLYAAWDFAADPPRVMPTDFPPDSVHARRDAGR